MYFHTNPILNNSLFYRLLLNSAVIISQGRRKVLNNGGHILTENENEAP